MWLYISNWYTHYKKWKSVFYKGPPFSSDCPNSISWDMIPQQNPGIWLADIQNISSSGLDTDVKNLSTNLVSNSPLPPPNAAIISNVPSIASKHGLPIHMPQNTSGSLSMHGGIGTIPKPSQIPNSKVWMKAME